MSNINKQSLVSIIYPKTGDIYDLPAPSAYNGSTSTMIDSGASASGHLLGAIIRDDVASVSLSWNYLPADVWADINSKFKTSANGSQYINMVRFFDQTTGGWDEREMHISDRSAGAHRCDDNGKIIGWLGCALDLAEV
jgi:hypothetical protein